MTGLRRFFPRRPAPPRPVADPTLECGASEAELREFLSADGAPDEADPRFRGIGIRIEDDLAITEAGHENLTSAIPKAPDELEALVGDR